jgi:hypothetical protein
MTNSTGVIIDECSPTQRAAEIAVELWQGEALTTRQIAERYGLTWRGADIFMSNIGGRLPIVKDEAGKWRRFQ